MKFNELFNQQRKLDTFIIESKKLEGNFYQQKLIAFNQEFAEFCNEIRFFKFWSSRKMSEKAIILEEYVDGLHFLLSIGLEFNTDMIISHEYKARMNYLDLADEYMYIEKQVVILAYEKDFDTYVELFENFLGFGSAIGLKWKEIEEAYYKKNIVNFKRQENDY